MRDRRSLCAVVPVFIDQARFGGEASKRGAGLMLVVSAPAGFGEWQEEPALMNA
ncbi:MAG: hypothetical protein GYA48_16545 [Chloroflexi bacterium]|nr:hypothetical protein [Chloroflexota bacterium]